jgi:hypothetical protein
MASMKTTLQAAGILALCTVLATAPIAAFAYTGQELASAAKLSIEQARAIALKARPGNITDQELVKESGGSGLRYSFDIKSGAKTTMSVSMPSPGPCWRTRPKHPTPIRRMALRPSASRVAP